MNIRKNLELIAEIKAWNDQRIREFIENTPEDHPEPCETIEEEKE